MAGYVHIMRLSTQTGTYDVIVAEYQVNYVDSGASYGVAWDEERVIEFLRTKVPLGEFETSRVISQLRETGHVTIGDVDLPASEATSMGMEVVEEG